MNPQSFYNKLKASTINIKLQKLRMWYHHIYEDMLRDSKTLEENELLNDTNIAIFADALQNQNDEEEVKVWACYFFNLNVFRGFQNEHRFINSYTLNCSKIIFLYHIIISGKIGH